jgi:hypothetical protein
MVTKQLKMSEIEALAVAKHGRRAYGMIGYVGDRRKTKANWQAVLDSSIDEYAEARHAQGVQYIRDKFPEFFGGAA